MMTEEDTMQVKPEKKEDRRVRRTKKLLTHGLIQLMKEKQVQDITVRELADLVDVNRGTFYLYYRDIFDMLDSIEQELFNQVNQLIAAHKGETVLTHTLPVLKELFHLVEENKELCQVLLGQNGDMKFLKKLSDVVQEAFRREWLMMKKDEVTFDYSYAFGALGFVGLLRTWLERDCVEKADDMAVLSDRMMKRTRETCLFSLRSGKWQRSCFRFEEKIRFRQSDHAHWAAHAPGRAADFGFAADGLAGVL
mgnify:CR=1 FL=1